VVGEKVRVELEGGAYMRTPLSFPRGGLARVRAVLKANGIAWRVEDRRTWDFPEPGFREHRLEPRGYQVEMIEAAVAKQNCLLHAPTGSGKTSAAFGLLARLKRRALVMVWTGNLLEQWRARCQSELGMEAGEIRGDKTNIQPVTLAMQQTIVSRFQSGDTELADAFDVVVCDEVQRFAAPTLFASVDPFTARYRVGISADSSRRDGKEFLTRDLFGQVAYEVAEDRLVDEGAVVEVEICVVPTDFRADWYRFGGQDAPGAYPRLLKQMVADEARNELALQIAQREMDEGEQVLLFSHRVEHARSLDATLVQRGYRSGVMLGGSGQAEVFRRTAAGLRDKGPERKMAGCGTYQAIAQGLDLPTVGRGIAVTPIGNNRQQMGQTKGRLCRSATGKGSGRLWYLHDRHVYGRKVIENLNKWFRVRALWNGEWVDGEEYVRRLRITA
jgi:superfamily II DNA or RNA helicase